MFTRWRTIERLRLLLLQQLPPLPPNCELRKENVRADESGPHFNCAPPPLSARPIAAFAQSLRIVVACECVYVSGQDAICELGA